MDTCDCVVAGASFAGLACATVLAQAGLRVVVMERKADPGEKLHTTGVLVKEAVERSPLLHGMPAPLVKRLEGVRLYAPGLRTLDLAAPGYFFLATDTPGLMRWLAQRAVEAGVELRLRTPFIDARREAGAFRIAGVGSTRYLVGADGPSSRVAAAMGLGRNTEFLFGIEHEYRGLDFDDGGRMHCFIDRKLAPGYLAWVVAGVGVVQVGLARRERGLLPPAREALAAFIERIAPVFDFRGREPASVRAGLIPCGGVVSPATAPRVVLVGDAAGLVSPLTAGGIHTALRYGSDAGSRIARFLRDGGVDPAPAIARGYPRFRTKRALRALYDRFPGDRLFDALLETRLLREVASRVYFHRKASR